MDSFDIARLAGVSRKTVTRVLNNQANVHPKTREKVMKVIQDHNYVPNASARQLSSRKRYMIGIIIMQNTGTSRIHTDDLYFGPVIGTIINAASDRGYNVITSIVDSSDPDSALKLFREKSIDAGILIGWQESDEWIHSLHQAGCCFGVFDYALSQGTVDYPVPVLENKWSAYEAVHYLHRLGHRDIAFLSGPPEAISSRERLAGYRLAMAEEQLGAAERIFYGDFSEQGGRTAAERLIEEGRLPTAVFAANDWMAIGMLKVFRERGIGVPEQVSVIGFDDLILSRYTTPTLTTMRVPTVEMGIYLTHSLIDRLEQRERKVLAAANAESGEVRADREPIEERMDSARLFRAVLVERESCRRLPT